MWPALALRAVHVHHGLHPDASVWSAHCQRIAEALGVTCEVVRVEVQRQSGRSIEEAARAARYAAFARMLRPGEALLTAHHADDQAETLLLNLLKGAGAAGLAAMPAVRPMGAGWLLRPLLGFRRAALLDYLRRAGVGWVDDPANADLRFDRNFLRHEILPRLTGRWPGAVVALCRSARNQADLTAIATEAAEDDLTGALDRDGALAARALECLDRVRQANLLRHWLKAGTPAVTASREQLERILDELLPASRHGSPRLDLNAVSLRGYRGRLYKLPNKPDVPRPGCIRWRLDAPLVVPALDLYLEPIALRRCLPALDTRDVVEVRFGVPGSTRFRPFGRAHSNTLKHWFQVWGVPPWERARVPVVFAGDTAVAVIGYGISAAVRAS